MGLAASVCLPVCLLWRKRYSTAAFVGASSTTNKGTDQTLPQWGGDGLTPLWGIVRLPVAATAGKVDVTVLNPSDGGDDSTGSAAQCSTVQSSIAQVEASPFVARSIPTLRGSTREKQGEIHAVVACSRRLSTPCGIREGEGGGGFTLFFSLTTVR